MIITFIICLTLGLLLWLTAAVILYDNQVAHPKPKWLGALLVGGSGLCFLGSFYCGMMLLVPYGLLLIH